MVDGRHEVEPGRTGSADDQRQTERVERLQQEGEGIRGYGTQGRTDWGDREDIEEVGSAGEDRSESERAAAEREHTREVREDAERRRPLEMPRAPDEVEDEIRARPAGREAVRERQRRDREEMGRPSMEDEGRAMQADVARRREREAEEQERQQDGGSDRE